jgi:small-conductance mechanosensitive channel
MRIDWLAVDGTLSRWEATLEDNASVLDNARNELAEIETSWRAVSEAEWYGRLSPSLTEKIDDLILKSVAVRDAVDRRAAALLVIQDEVASGRARVKDALERTFKLSSEVSEQMFAVENVPLWSALAEERPRFSLALQTIESWRAAVADVVRTLRDNPKPAGFQLVLFVMLAGGGIYLVRRVRRDPSTDAAAAKAAEFLDRPYSAAATLVLFTTFVIYPPISITVRDAALTLLLIPYIRLVPKVVPVAARGAAFGLGVLFLLDRLHDFALPHSLLQRLLLFVIGVVGVGGWTWAHRATVRADSHGEPPWKVGWRIIARIAIAALAVAIVANAVGNVSLAEQLTVVAVKGVFAGGILYLIARILESLYVLTLRYLAWRGAHIVVRNAGLLERRGKRTIQALALGTWIVFLLWIMRIIEQSGRMALEVFSKRWTLGHVEIGLGALVAFATALTIGIVAARMLRFILDEAVFPHMSLPRGVPAAISTTVGYLIVTTGFVMAFLAAGLEMSQFTFLAGAFGLGIGFGLQNVVNNFVSGLILLFERPIQVGDVLTVGTLQGHVRRIGIRSSTLATFDGAEVIVPNASLIATEVVNWTLSDRLRRVEITVGVAYASDPRAVLALLLKVARGHADVLAAPAPSALFMGFGESSLNFELRIWTPDYDTYVRVASDVRTEIFSAFREVGIEIPYPQRDLHVKSIEAGALRP